MNNTTNTTDNMFYVNPDIPSYVYIGSCYFLVFLCIFGVTANFSIIALFWSSSMVSQLKPIFYKNNAKQNLHDFAPYLPGAGSYKFCVTIATLRYSCKNGPVLHNCSGRRGSSLGLVNKT